MGADPPASRSLRTLAKAAGSCTGCELYRDATQTVFGGGPGNARVMLVGEQPGDVEDREGVPFVGPAGALLDRALAEAGLVRAQTYLTNAVKHFHFVQRGKRRLHQTPRAVHVTACRPWLAAELDAVRPAVVVALGAVAAKTMFGPSFVLTRHRNERLDWPADGPLGEQPGVQYVLTTIHPSAVLRAGERRHEAYAGLVSDLRLAR